MVTFSYIDPGLGLLAWQALVALFIGLLFYIKKTRSWLASQFRRLVGLGRPPEKLLTKPPPPAKDAGQ